MAYMNYKFVMYTAVDSHAKKVKTQDCLESSLKSFFTCEPILMQNVLYTVARHFFLEMMLIYHISPCMNAKSKSASVEN